MTYHLAGEPKRRIYMLYPHPSVRCRSSTICTPGGTCSRLWTPSENFWPKGTLHYLFPDYGPLTCGRRYKDAVDALKRKQDKEREAAGLGPVQRMGAKASPASPRGRGGRGGSVAPRGRGGGTSNVPRTMHMGADKNLYVHLVGHLKKKNLLPVVVLT